MTAEFSAQLDQLLHIARDRIDHIDSATNHVNALTERYQMLADAIAGCHVSRQTVEDMLRSMMQPQEPNVVDYDRRRVA